MSATYRWFWGEDREELLGYIRYTLGRGMFIETGSDGRLTLGLSRPRDISEETGENTLKFDNVRLCEAPLFEGHGYVVTRLPPRPMLAQLAREESRDRDDIPDMEPNPPEVQG